MNDQLRVSANQDASEPQRTPEREKHPKSIAPPVGRGGIPKQCRIGKKRDQTRQEITQGGLRRAERKQYTDDHVATGKKQPSA